MRVALCSAAHLHVDAYVDNLRAVTGVQVVGIADDDRLRAERWASARDVAVYASYEALLDAGVDAVVVCAETARHRRVVELAAAAGAHVLCEKPLATTVEDAEAIVAACSDAGVGLMTAFPMRFSPAIREVRAMLESGALGRVQACTGTNQGQLPMADRSWFADPVLAGGGALMDHVVHIADVLRWYLGAEVGEVYAVTNRILHGETVTVETGALVLLTLTDGTFASIDASWSRPTAYPTWGGLTLELVGEHGAVAVDPFRQRLTVHADAGPSLTWPPWGSDPNQAMMDEFVAAVREGRPPAVTGEDGLRATRIALAAAESARAGRPVQLR